MQVPLALGTSVLVFLSHGPIAGKGVVIQEATPGLGPCWLAQLFAVISAEKQKAQSSGPKC